MTDDHRAVSGSGETVVSIDQFKASSKGATNTGAPKDVGGRGGGGMDPNQYTDIKIGELAARFEALVDRLGSRMDTLRAEMREDSANLRAQIAGLPDRNFQRNWNLSLIAVIAAAFFGVVGILAYGSQQFSSGIAVSTDVKRAADADEALTEQAKALLRAMRNPPPQ